MPSPEIVNVKEVTAICQAAPATPDDTALISALNSRYPDTPFKLISKRSGRTWDVGIIEDTGTRITDNLGAWIDQELALTNNEARAVWEKYKDKGMIRTEREGSSLFLTAPFGPDPDQFHQLEILSGEEVTTQLLFNPKDVFPPEDRHDLVNGHYLLLSEKKKRVLSPARYEFHNLINVRHFVKSLVERYKQNRLAEYPELQKKVVRIQNIDLDAGEQTTSDVPFLDLCPDWLDRLPSGYRLFQDWAESSAGRGGRRFCDHWWLEAGTWKENGEQQYSLIPQWSDADGGLDLPEITPDWEASPYGVMESLSQFDKQVGYLFAWYFYMLHGNRISNSAGGVIANAIKDGLLYLPGHDKEVLMRWRTTQYGF
jgi:hypothetical protein